MVECGICLEEYQEGDLELHRQMCEVRLMFRCSLCDSDYVNKEGLWNHLDLHEIADESKELHYQEIKAKHKLHQCVLCNDQRAYSEISYWKHVHDVHDGFFLRCSDCGENFRSEKLKNDHASSRCKAGDPMEEEQDPIEVGNMTADAELLKLSLGDQSSNTNEGPDNRLSTEYADKNIIDKESELPTINLSSRFPCDNCGQQFSSKRLCLRHKAAKCTSMQGRQHNSLRSSSSTKCLHCNKECNNASSLRQHISNRHQPTKCSICGITFEGHYQARYHKIQAHSETQNHTKPRYECVKCSKKFICIALYKHHSNVCDSVQNDSSSHKSSGELILKYKRYKKLAVEKNQKVNRYKELKYQCPNCWRKFHDKKKYDTHCYFCEQKKYSCKLCGHMFKEIKTVKSHNKRFHPEETSFKNIQIHQIKKQMIFHKPRKANFQCPHCSRNFRLKKKFEDHAASCANLKHSCELCGQRFILRNLLDNHKKRIHLASGLFRNANIVGTDSDEEQTQNSVEKIDAAQETIICSKVAAENPLNEAFCTKCSHCGIEESSAVALTRHVLNHHDPVACDFCGVTFSNLSQAQHHVKTKHKDSQLKCAHCSRRFSLRVRFEKHVSKCEKEIIPCEFCGTMFENATAVTEHMRLTCRAYNRIKEQEQKNAMTTSLGAKTDSSTAAGDKISPSRVESGLSKTKCLYCDEEFPSPEYLTIHLKTCHELTKCDICGITIIGLSSNKNHKLKCHQEPKYECQTCGRKFHCKRLYNKHCFACEHKLYSCKSCGHTFKQRYSIQKHTKRCHPGENILENIEIIQGEKQVQNIDLKMEITVEETTISAPEDQGLSSVNPSSTADASNSRSNEDSSAYLNDDEIMDSQVTDKESPMISVAPLNDIRQDVKVEISQPLEENLPNQLYSCNICGITMHRYSRLKYHKATKHKEGRHQCPNCSRKFHFKTKLEEHVSCCASLKHSCELCGQKFNFRSRVDDHKKRVHHDSSPLRDANIEGPDCTEEKKQDSVEKIDAAEEKTSCMVCRISFASTDELMKHKLNCPKFTFSTEDISLFHGVSEAQANSTIVAQAEIIKLKLEIEEDDTLLQEQELQAPNENPERPSATTLLSCPKHVKEHDAFPFGAEDTSLLHVVKDAQTNSTIGEHIELKLETEVEGTMLQEQEYTVPNESPERSAATAMKLDITKWSSEDL